ncbi:hypothetical protein VKT23_012424 [Stygiomarasmius scandens]
MMFICSAGTFANDITDIITQINSFPKTRFFDTSLTSTRTALVLQVITARISFLCGDATVVWRAWILFERKSKYRIFLGICMLITFATSVIDTCLQMTNSPTEDFGWGWIILPVGLLFTNLVATSLIALKAWQYRQFFRENHMDRSGKDQIAKILVLLIESGGVYCLLWVVYGVMQAVDPLFIGTDVIAGLGPHVSCLYLLSIIILTANQKTQCDTTLQGQLGSQSIQVQFAVPPQGTLSYP